MPPSEENLEAGAMTLMVKPKRKVAPCYTLIYILRLTILRYFLIIPGEIEARKWA